jgi:formiminotetrahydrofolate cyclodeaminase
MHHTMNSTTDEKATIEKMFQELMDKAQEIYPDIQETIDTFTNMNVRTAEMQSYLEMINQTPTEISTNQIFFK